MPPSRVRDCPPAVRRQLEISPALALPHDRRRLGGKRVPGVVERRTGRRVGQGDNVSLDDGVREAVDHGVEPDGEDVLVVLGADARRNGGGKGACAGLRGVLGVYL